MVLHLPLAIWLSLVFAGLGDSVWSLSLLSLGCFRSPGKPAAHPWGLPTGGLFRGAKKLLICCPGCSRSPGRPSDCWVFCEAVKLLTNCVEYSQSLTSWSVADPQVLWMQMVLNFSTAEYSGSNCSEYRGPSTALRAVGTLGCIRIWSLHGSRLTRGLSQQQGPGGRAQHDFLKETIQNRCFVK